MNCEQMEERIALFISGDLDASETATLEIHLSRCRACAERSRELQNVHATLLSLRGEGVEPSDCTAVRRAVLERIESGNHASGWFRILPRPVPVALAAIAVLSAGILWIRGIQTVHAPVNTASREGNIRLKVEQPAAQSLHNVAPAGSISRQHEVRAATVRRSAAHLPRKAAVRNSAAAVETPTSSRAILPMDEIAIKLETEDPNIVIIWLASSTGGELK